MKPCPATVAAAAEPGYQVMMVVELITVDTKVTFAAKFNRRVAHVDADILAAAGAKPPKLGRRKRGCPDRCLRRRTDRE